MKCPSCNTEMISTAVSDSIESWEIKDDIIDILLEKYNIKPLIAHALLISVANELNKECLNGKFIITVKNKENINEK